MQSACIIRTDHVYVRSTLWASNWKESGLNLGRDTGFPDCGVSCSSFCPSSTLRESTTIKQQPLPFKSYTIHQSFYHSTLNSLRKWQRRKIIHNNYAYTSTKRRCLIAHRRS